MWWVLVFHHGCWYLRHAIFGELSEQWKTLEEPWPLVEVVPGGSVQAMGHVSEVYLKIGWNLLMVQMSLQLQIVCKSLNLNMIYAIPEAHMRSNQCNVISFNHLQSGDAKGSVDLTASFWVPQGIWGVSSCDHCSGKLGFLEIQFEVRVDR